MKIPIIAIVLLAIGSVGLRAQTPTTAATQGNVPPPTDYQIVQQDGNSRVWQREIYEQEPNGQIISRPHKFTELATGLNYKDSSGQWQPSKEEIDIQPDGTLAATQGQHQVYFPGNIYGGEIKLVQPNGVQLHSCPVGLSYDDGSNTVLIAVLTNSIGQLVGPNQVIYTNAFVGLDADLLYTYTKAGLEQDVVLREQPPTPASLGLDPDTTRLQVLTEFLNPPQPAETTSTLPEQAGVALTDDTLDFGTMQMIPGKAFKLGEDSPSARVGKSWVTLQGRQFLVEAVPVAALAEQLDALPAPMAQTTSTAKARVISRNLVLPPQHLAKAGVQPLKLAGTGTSRKPGVVLDYLTMNSSVTNYTFQGDTTYYISGTTILYETNTFEGGAVLKYATNASIGMGYIAGGHNPEIIWKGSAYRPVIFTAKDDNSVGDEISGSTGSPSGYYANPALDVTTQITPTISGFRFLYAKEALIQGSVNGTPTFKNGQFVNCACGFSDAYFSANLENVLFENVQTDFFNLQYATLNVENSTFSSNSYLTTADSGISYQTLVPTFTNCIFANVANLTNNSSGTDLIYGVSGGYNGFYNSPNFGSITVTNPFYPFQTVGGGKCYLTNGCYFHNAGTTNIDPVLLVNLATKTTYPPIVYSNVTIITNLVLGPQAPRDTNATPDLGYHYDPIDYFVDEFGITNSSLTINDGTAVAFDNSAAGICLQDGSSISSIGTVLSPNWFVHYTCVQEQPVLIGTNGGTGGFFSDALLMWTYFYTNPVQSEVFQFSKFAIPAGSSGFFLYDDRNWTSSSTLIQNCEFYNNQTVFDGSGSAINSTALLENNLFDGVSVSGNNTGVTNFSLSVSNCLFFDASVTFYSGVNSNQWYFFNNDFDSSTITINSKVKYLTTNGYNAYLNCTGNLNPTNATDIFTSGGLAYQTSFFGQFYQPTNSPLINKGSTTGNLAALYYFTTQTNQEIQGDSQVDIGYHYVATSTNGLPLETFNDGIPDYLDDPQGNGLPNWWELEYFGNLNQSATNDYAGDGYSDLAKYLNGLNPTNYVDGFLASWTFMNTNSWAGDQDQIPSIATNLSALPAPCGNALNMSVTNTGLLAYRATEAGGNANIDYQNGSIAFFFEPMWSSASVGGVGPGSNARLIESGNYSPSFTNNWWSIFLSSNGDQLFFASSTNGGGQTNLTASISWTSNNWYQVTMTYCPTGTSLYVNLQLLTNGSNFVYPEGVTNGFRIGSDAVGNEQAGGEFSVLSTYNFPLSTNQIGQNPSQPLPEIIGAYSPGVGYCGGQLPPSYAPYILPLLSVGTSMETPEPVVINETVSIDLTIEAYAGLASFTIDNDCLQPIKSGYIGWGIESDTVDWSVYNFPSISPFASGSANNANSDDISYSPTQSGNDELSCFVMGVTGSPIPGWTFNGNRLPLAISVFPRMRLGYWPFDDPSLVNDRGQLPIVMSNCNLVPAPFGNGIDFNSSSSINLEYSYYQNDNLTTTLYGYIYNFSGTPNFRWNRGTVRFWYSPDYSSGSSPANGGDFLNVTLPGYGNWSLVTTNKGSTLELDTDNGFSSSHCAQTVNFTSGQWYQIAATYSPTEVTIYVNGAQVGSVGSGVAQVGYNPGTIQIGSDGASKQVRGIMENIETFNYELSASQILSDYQSDSAIDTDGAGISNIQQFEMGINPSDPPGGGASGTTPSGAGETSPPVIQLLDPVNAVLK